MVSDPRERRMKIELTGVGRGRIEIEGKDVSAGVRSFVLRAGVGEVAEIELDVVAPKGGTFDGVARIEITPELRAIMLAAGWTPAEPVEPLSAA